MYQQEELKKELQRLLQEQGEENEELLEEIKQNGEAIEQMQKKIHKNNEEQEQYWKNQQEMQEEFLKQYMASGTVKDAIKDNIADIFNPMHYMELKKGEDGKYHRLKTKRAGGVDGAFWRKKTDGVSARFMNRIKWDKMFGISEQEKKLLQKEYKDLKSSIVGVLSAIYGLPMLGVNAPLGIGLLAKGLSEKAKMKKKIRNLRIRPAYKLDKSYKFKAFSDGTQKSIQAEAIKQMQYAQSQLTRRNMKKHQILAKKIMSGTTIITKPIVIAGVTVSGVGLGLPLTTKGMYGKKGKRTRFRVSPTNLDFMEQEKFDGLYQKELRDKFKAAKKEWVHIGTKDLLKDYGEEFGKYKRDVEQEVQGKTKEELILRNALAKENTVLIGQNVVEIKQDNEQVNKFMHKADEIDQKSDLSRAQKVSRIKREIARNETALIQNSMIKLCASKGITDINGLNLDAISELQIQKYIIGMLENTGIIQKGEIKLEDKIISKEKISTVYEDLTKEDSKTAEANNQIEDKLVQESVLEYMLEKNVTDTKMLKNDETKQEIYDIIKEKIMSNTSKSSANVISQLTGQDRLKEEMELSEGIKQKVDNTPKKVKKKSIVKLTAEKGMTKEKLIQRETNRRINETKNKLESAVYEEEDTVDMEDEAQLKLLLLLSEIGEQNLRAEKVGEKASQKRKEKTFDEMMYHQEIKQRKQEKTSEYGNFQTSRQYKPNQVEEISKKMKNLETAVHGPAIDVIDLINKVGNN